MGCLPQLLPILVVVTESLTETEAFSLVTLGGKHPRDPLVSTFPVLGL